MNITLIGAVGDKAPQGFRSFRNLWMLEELEVDYTHVPALPRSEEALKHNPFGAAASLWLCDEPLCLQGRSRRCSTASSSCGRVLQSTHT